MTGTTISHYQIEHELGRGGMGVVYKARDTRLNRTVAIKVLPAHALASEEDRARFYREAQAAAALSHANIATVYEIDESVVIPTEGGTSPGQAAGSGEPQPFIAMEFVEGESLADRIAKGPLPLKVAISIARQIADGLHAAHAKNIVHRDIKSGNVMLTADGQAKILDFGLAKTAASTRLTNLGSTLGTIAYMSPEQARGEEVNRRTDIWSLGAVLYEMVTGRMPFPGDYEQAVVYGILNEEPEPPTALRTGVPMELERIVAKCLAKDAARRYQHADELAVDLDSVDIRPSGFSTIAPAVATAVVSKRMSLSLPIVAGLVIAAAVLSVVATALLRPPPERPRVSRQHLLVSSDWPSRPALSPDGGLLAFRGYNESGAGLHIYNFETGNVIAVPDITPSSISFSPDGSRIAFLSAGELITVSASGDAATVVSDEPNGWGLVWGPQGEFFFQKNRQIVRVASAGESSSLILSPDSSKGEVAMYPGQLLPDGRTLLATVTRGSPERDDLIAIDVETGGSIDIAENAGYQTAYSPSGHLVYITQQEGPLYVRPFDPEKLELLGPVTQAVSSVFEERWAFSRSGRFANIVRSYPGERLLTIDREGSERPLMPDTLNLGSFRVSPTGRYIAATIYGEGDGQIHVLDQETGSLRQLTFTSVSSNYSTWSPNEDMIAFVSRHEETTMRIYVRRADGSETARLLYPTSDHAFGPDWSPDGNSIVFQTENDLWIYSFADSSARALDPLVNERGGQFQPRYSPDGRYLVYRSTETGNNEVFVASVDGRSKWSLTTGGGFRPRWSSDQRRIYYQTDTAIYEVRVEFDPTFRPVGQPRVVYASDESIYGFDVVPNNGGFIVKKPVGDPTSHFEIVDNWFQYLEQIAPHPE